MNANSKLHQARLQEWAKLCADQKASGLHVREWCTQNQISIHKYNYWKHQLKESFADKVLPDIVPLFPSSDETSIVPFTDSTNCTNCTNRAIPSVVTIALNGLTVSLDPSVPEEFLCTLIKAVRNA